MNTAEVAVPAAARMRLQDHRQRRPVGRFVESPHLRHERFECPLQRGADADFFRDGEAMSWSSFLLRVCFDPPELATPVLGKHPAPVVDGAKSFCVRSIQGPAAVAPHRDQTDAAELSNVPSDPSLEHQIDGQGVETLFVPKPRARVRDGHTDGRRTAPAQFTLHGIDQRAPNASVLTGRTHG